MPIIQIAPVTRRGIRLLISFYGLSESGKTLSALLLAAGLEPDPAKRGLLDTEGGQRGRMYVDDVPGGYLYGQLTPPFTPERYVEAISDFEAAGVNVLVIDSNSHVWYAEGGVIDMVDSDTSSNEMAKWKKPKRRLGKMTGRIFRGDMHIILCSRARQPLIDNGKDVKPRYIEGPITPIQDKALWYDLTIAAQMISRGTFTIDRPQGKCPGALMPIFRDHATIGIDMGKKLREWVAADGGLTPDQRKLEIDATEMAEEGSESFREWWKKLSKDDRAFLQPRMGNFESIAKAADLELKQAADEQKQAVQTLDSPISAAAAIAASPSVSETAARWVTDLRACTTKEEFEKKWEAAPIEVNRELGGIFFDEQMARFAEPAAVPAEGRLL